MTEINKYSRNYENLNQIELKILLKHYDESYSPQKYKNKEEMVAALVSYIPNFNSISNTEIYYFSFDVTNNLTTWYKNSECIRYVQKIYPAENLNITDRESVMCKFCAKNHLTANIRLFVCN